MKTAYFNKNEPWKDIPLDVIIRKRQEERRRNEEWDRQRKQPSVYEDIPYNPPKDKEEPKRGVAIIKMYG